MRYSDIDRLIAPTGTADASRPQLAPTIIDRAAPDAQIAQEEVPVPVLTAAIFPFSTTAALDAKIATALVNLAIGIVVGTLVGGVAARSIP